MLPVWNSFLIKLLLADNIQQANLIFIGCERLQIFTVEDVNIKEYGTTLVRKCKKKIRQLMILAET